MLYRISTHPLLLLLCAAAGVGLILAVAFGVDASSYSAPAPQTVHLDPVPDREAAGAWQVVETENEPAARHENAFVEVNDRFYLLGGRGQRPVNVYDPATKRWSTGAAPPFQMHHFQAVGYEGKIYVVGAWTGDFPRERGLSRVYVYDPAANRWSKGPEIPADRRRGAAAAVVYDGSIYVVGGNDGGHGPHAQAVDWFDRFDPESGTWTALRDKPAPHVRDHFHAAVVGDELYAVGGRNSGLENFIDSTIAAVDVYDFATGTWDTVEGEPIPTERAGSTTVAYDDMILVMGGEGFGQTWGQTEAFDTTTKTWRLVGTLNQPRHGTQAFVYRDAVYIAAGSGDQGGGPELTSMEVFTFE